MEVARQRTKLLRKREELADEGNYSLLSSLPVLHNNNSRNRGKFSCSEQQAPQGRKVASVMWLNVAPGIGRLTAMRQKSRG